MGGISRVAEEQEYLPTKTLRNSSPKANYFFLFITFLKPASSEIGKGFPLSEICNELDIFLSHNLLLCATDHYDSSRDIFPSLSEST